MPAAKPAAFPAAPGSAKRLKSVPTTCVVLTQLEQVLEAQRSLAEQLQAAVLLILVKTADLEPSEAKRLIRRVMTPPGA
jgi:hypothetical protein